MTQIETPLEIRKRNFSHEVALRSLGLLYYFPAVLGAGSSLSLIVMGFKAKWFIFIAGLLMLAMSATYFTVAGRLRRLDPSARTPAIILSCIGLLAFPVGTAISTYILYLVASAKGTLILSSEYGGIVESTPEIEYRVSKLIKGLLVVLGILLVFVLFGLVLIALESLGVTK